VGAGGAGPLTSSGPRRHFYLNNTRNEGFSPNTACFYLGNIDECISAGPSSFAIFWENRFGDSDAKHEQLRQSMPRLIPPHRWLLLTYFWDMVPPTQPDGSGDLSARVLVNRGQAPGDRNSSGLYIWGPTIEGPGIDFSVQAGGTATFYLGTRGTQGAIVSPVQYGAPDITFDEFAIHDFGPATGAAGDAIERTEKLAQSRFRSGRFYKESAYNSLNDPGNLAGEYFSAPLDLGPGVRILGLAWTQVVPRELRAPAGPLPEDGDPGPDGGISFELTDPAGTGYLMDAHGIPFTRRLRRPKGSPVARTPAGAFRLHAVFQPNLDREGLLNKAILDPLALDDLTLLYRPGTGIALLSWGDGAE
jgi:hypothetical protein